MTGIALAAEPPAVHLWIADSVELDEATTARCLAWCSEEEHARHHRITHEATRRNHLVARALVRTTLSRYADVPPGGWRFVENDHGCPAIAPEQNEADLRFNLSHTTDLVVCAVTCGRAVGVDVEWEPRKSQTTKIAHRFFAPSEVAALKRLDVWRGRDL